MEQWVATFQQITATVMHRMILLLALALVSTALATDNPTKIDHPTLAGGYSPAEIDPEVSKVAEFAVKTQAEATGRPLQFVKILKVEQQVVPGLNYRLEIEVSDVNKHVKAHAVVWKKLDGSLALTSWD